MPIVAAIIGFAIIGASLWFNRGIANALKKGPPPKAAPKFKYIVNPGADWEADALKAYLLEQGKRLEPDRKGKDNGTPDHK